MSGRDAILGRLRRHARGDARAKAAAARLETPAPRAPIPAQARLEGAAAQAQFITKLRAADATLTELPDLAALPHALADELRARNLPAAIRMGGDPAFAALGWGGLEISHGPGRREEPAALSMARWAVAETGTLALLSGPDNPVTLTFLPETHFVALRRRDILGGFEGLWRALRASGANPRTVNLVTGPSRSADIGQTLLLGAHGPVALHVFLIDA